MKETFTFHVNVYPASEPWTGGYIAVAAEATTMWAHAETIDGAIEKFQQQYGGLLKIQFNQTLDFDFAVKLKGK